MHFVRAFWIPCLDQALVMLLMVILNTVVDQCHPIPVNLGFIMSARIVVTKRLFKDEHNQGCIHNDKKILNLLDHPT